MKHVEKMTTCANTSCAKKFTPLRATARFCSATCRKAASRALADAIAPPQKQRPVTKPKATPSRHMPPVTSLKGWQPPATQEEVEAAQKRLAVVRAENAERMRPKKAPTSYPASTLVALMTPQIKPSRK